MAKKQQRFLQKMEKFFPVTTKVVRIFSAGFILLFQDFKEYIKIARFIDTPGRKDKFETLSRREIELYHQLPKDLVKMSPVLIISLVPYICYMIFHLAYLYPRQLLSSQFWNTQQKAEFNTYFLKKRIIYNESLFRCLLNDLDDLKRHRLYKEWANIVGMLGSGFQPQTEQILDCKEMFMCPPYHLHYLKRKHIKYLLRIHDLHTGMFKKTSLIEKAKILKEMDRAIVREGGVSTLSSDILRNACFIRGLCPDNMEKAEMIRWLNKWITISSVVDKNSLSLLLHCPILLTYAEGTNWRLIHYKESQNTKKRLEKSLICKCANSSQ